MKKILGLVFGLLFLQGQALAMEAEDPLAEEVLWLNEGTQYYNAAEACETPEEKQKLYDKAFGLYQKAAERKLPAAEFNLGVMYAKGHGVKQSYEEALKWYKKAAEQGFAQAQNNLGGLYREGYGVERSEKEAAELFQKGAAQGLADAQNNLGNIYFQGRGVKQSYEEAAKWYKKAAEQGFAVSQNNMGFMCLGGHGSAHPDQEAVEWFQKASAQGHIRATDNLSLSYFLGHGTLKAEGKALKNATPGLCEEFSLPFPQNICAAVELIKKILPFEKTTFDHFRFASPYLETIPANNPQKSAAGGNPVAQLHLGLLHHFGIGARQDLVQAFEWYEEAAQRSHQDAKNLLQELHSSFLPPIIKKVEEAEEHKYRYRLGRRYLYGWGASPNKDLALTCFKKSAQDGWYSPAQKALAQMSESDAEVIRWYRRAARQGDMGGTAAIKKMVDDYVGEAMYALGQAYEEGWAIAKDPEEALVWYHKAAEDKKYPKAQYKLAMQDLENPSALELLSEASGVEERKAYLKAIGKKFKQSEIDALKKRGPGYYRAQQALAAFYEKGRIIPFTSLGQMLTAYERAVALHENAKGKHRLQEPALQAQAKYDQLQQNQAEGIQFEVLKNFSEFYEKREIYGADFLYPLVYVLQKAQGTAKEEQVHDMLRLLADASNKKKKSKILSGLTNNLVKMVKTGATEKLSELSSLLTFALVEKSWCVIPKPATIAPEQLKLSVNKLQDKHIELFNSCHQLPDQPVPPKIFEESVKKILRLFDDLKVRKYITEESLWDGEEGVQGTRDKLKSLLTYNQSQPRFAYRIVRLSDILDKKLKRDPEHVAALLMSWAPAGNFCPHRSEDETYTYYLAQLTDPTQDLNDLGKYYWTLELYVARSLANLRQQLVGQLVPGDERERIHQVGHVMKKVRQRLSLLGDAECYKDSLEEVSVLSTYKEMSAEKIVEDVLKSYTPDSMAAHIAKEIDGATIPYEKVVRRLKFQCLREDCTKALEKPVDALDQDLFYDEDFVLSAACDQNYVTSLKHPVMWEELKRQSFEKAQQALQEDFYEEHMMHFSRKGAYALLKGLGYLEDPGF